MEPIDAYWIYSFQLICVLKTVSIVFSVISGMVWVALAISFLLDDLGPEGKKWLRIIAYCFGFSVVLCVILPSKETMLMMVIAQNGNGEEVSEVIAAIKEAADNIIQTLASS